jgi:hypothetical protein
MSASDLEPLSLLRRAAEAERHVQRLEGKYNTLVDIILIVAGAWAAASVKDWTRPSVGWLVSEAAFAATFFCLFMVGRYLFLSA